MKKELLIGTAIILITGLSGCSNDDKENTTWGPSAPDANITASLPSGFVWNNNLKVGIYSAQAYDNGTLGVTNKAISITSGTGTNTAGLADAIKPGEGTNKFYAYYPYNETAGQNPAKVKVTLPATQKQTNVNPLENNAEYSFFYGTQTATPVASNPMAVNFNLNNLFCVLEFNISTEEFGVGKQISEITVSTEDAKLAGEFGVNLTIDKVTADNAPEASYASHNTITLQCEGTGGMLAATPIKARIAMNPVQLEGKQLSITVKIENDSWEFKEDGRNYLANKVYPVEVTLNTPPINLNEKGYANSYMVNKANTAYKFDAKIQGNGKATTGITPQAIAPKDVFVVWESTASQGGVIKDVKLSTDGIVSFTTSSNIGGNALIAVTDGEATEEFPKGTILWSWHIWSTNYDISQDVTVENTDQQSFQFMNINLGALNTAPDEKGYGLKYQWGRKDPFYYDGIPASGEVTTGFISEPKYGWQSSSYAPEGDGDNLSLYYSAVFPTAFFKGGVATSNDWYGIGIGIENRNNNLWGNPENGLGTKSIYDPCPVGYRVPPQAACKSFTKPKYANFGCTFTGAEGLFFIGAGNLVHSSGTIAGEGYNKQYSLRYWTTNTKNTDAISYKYDLPTSSPTFYFNNNQITQRAQGSSVRCIRE